MTVLLLALAIVRIASPDVLHDHIDSRARQGADAPALTYGDDPYPELSYHGYENGEILVEGNGGGVDIGKGVLEMDCGGSARVAPFNSKNITVSGSLDIKGAVHVHKFKFSGNAVLTLHLKDLCYPSIEWMNSPDTLVINLENFRVNDETEDAGKSFMELVTEIPDWAECERLWVKANATLDDGKFKEEEDGPILFELSCQNITMQGITASASLGIVYLGEGNRSIAAIVVIGVLLLAAIIVVVVVACKIRSAAAVDGDEIGLVPEAESDDASDGFDDDEVHMVPVRPNMPDEDEGGKPFGPADEKAADEKAGA